jgi:hypothetical protein
MQESIRAAEAAARAAADGIAGLRESTAEWEAAETAARSELESSESAMATRESEFLARQEELFAVGALTPLTPEQLCRSMMQATGALAAQRSAAGAEYDAAHPAPPEGHSPASAMEREAAVEASVREKIRGAEAEFVRLFGGGAGQPQGDFFATVDQALYFSNGGTVQSWLAPANGNLTDRLVKMQDSVALAEELYLCVLSRQPSNEEEAEVGTYLQQRGEARSEAVQELCWALLGSTEFRFHH